MLAHLGKLSHNDNNQRSERIGADTNIIRERVEQSSLNGSPLSVGDEAIGLDPDPVSSSVEHAAVRQRIKHLLGVSS